MRLHSRVERRVFEREVENIRREEGALRSVGVWVARIDWPEIDVMLVPYGPLLLEARVPSSRLIVAPGQQFELRSEPIPNLSARSFGVRLDLRGYDQRPPSVQFFELPQWTPASFAILPMAQIAEDPTRPLTVLIGMHPRTGRPFLCMRGVREYHEHPQHDGDDWALYRASLGVVGLLRHLARAMVDALEARLQPVMQANRVNLIIRWLLRGHA